MASFLFRKLAHSYIWKRIFYERLTEPLHLNLLTIPVALFGGLRSRVSFDLVLRHHNAYATLRCADIARELGLREVTLIEFGVAAGAGLLNMCEIARKVTRATGVEFRVVGFDTGKGMPPPQSYRDHPELYQEGDFPMDQQALSRALPANAELILGDISANVESFLRRVTAAAPIGYVVVDVDFYHSARDALRVLQGAPEQYLPRTFVYLDDLEDESHNSWCGELLATGEFNAQNAMRKIERHRFLRSYRIFRNARWIDHMMICHVLDHATRTMLKGKPRSAVLDNPYLG